MKFNRGVALGTSLVLILAACGDSSSSSRDRNASFAGTECYTKEEFPALKTQATAMSDAYVVTAKEVEAAKELATTNLLAWEKSDSKLIALRKPEMDAQAAFDKVSKTAAETLSIYNNAVNLYSESSKAFDSEKTITASAVANLGFEKDSWQVKLLAAKAALEKIVNDRLPEPVELLEEIKAKCQTSRSSTGVYNALVAKYE